MSLRKLLTFQNCIAFPNFAPTCISIRVIEVTIGNPDFLNAFAKLIEIYKPENGWEQITHSESVDLTVKNS